MTQQYPQYPQPAPQGGVPDIDALRQGATPAPAGGGGADGPPKFTFTQPGEEVFGQVTRAEFEITTPYGLSDVIEVNDAQRGPLTLWLGTSQLAAGLVEGKNQLGRRIQASDIVYIRFDRTEARPNGNTLKHFSINLQAGPPLPQSQPQQQAPAPQQPHAPAGYVPTGAPQPWPQPAPQQPVPSAPLAWPQQQGGFPTPV